MYRAVLLSRLATLLILINLVFINFSPAQNIPVNGFKMFSCSGFNKLFVDSSKGISGDGLSWAGAFRNLTEALSVADQCVDVDSILVAKGTYKPSANYRDTSFCLFRGHLKLYGGYTSGGSTRNVLDNPTILSGNIGNINDSTDNCYHVIVIAGLTNMSDSLIVDGFVISSGNANGSNLKYYYNTYIGSTSIARNYGGGINLYSNNDAGNKISIRNCTITRNNSGYIGGGIYNDYSSPLYIKSNFSFNYCSSSGAGMSNNWSSPNVNGCNFSFNQSGGSGGGVDNYASGTGNTVPNFTNCVFANNTSSPHGVGGGMCNNVSSPALLSCSFYSNSGFSGGGIFNGNNSANGSSPTLTNCNFIVVRYEFEHSKYQRYLFYLLTFSGTKLLFARHDLHFYWL